MSAKNFAIVGATGAVGAELITCLERLDVPVSSMRLLASKRSAGTWPIVASRGLTAGTLPACCVEPEPTFIVAGPAPASLSGMVREPLTVQVAPSAATGASATMVPSVIFFVVMTDLPFPGPTRCPRATRRRAGSASLRAANLRAPSPR